MHKIIGIMLALAVILTGCDMFTPVKYATSFSISGLVKDGGTPGKFGVPGASVALSTTGKVETTNEGAFVFGNVANGDYSMGVSKPGYTTATFSVKIDGTSVMIPNLGLTTYASTAHADVVIYPLTANATFTLRIKDNNFNSEVVSTLPTVTAFLMNPAFDKTGAPILDDNEKPTYTADLNNRYVGTIDANGKVTFTGLPVAPAVKFVVSAFTDTYGNVYKETEIGTDTTTLTGTTTYPSLATGTNTIVDAVNLPLVPITSTTLPAILSNNFNNQFPVSGTPLHLTFNKAIDKARTGPTLKLSTVTLSAVWAADMKSVDLTPQKTLALATNYTLTGTLYSTDGFSQAIADQALRTVPGIQYVSSNMLAEDFNSNRLATTTALTITVNQTIDHLGTVTLYQGTSNAVTSGTGTLVKAAVTFAADTVTITPENALYSDTFYIVYATIYGAGDGLTNSISFTDTSSPALLFRTQAATVTPVAPGAVSISIGAVDAATTSIPINLATEVANATSYRAYARVTGSGNSWVLVGTANSQVVDWNPALSNPLTITNTTVTADLTNANYKALFDRYSADTVQSPFAGSQSIDFKVVGYNANYGEGPNSNIKAMADSTVPSVDSSVIPAGWAVGASAATALSFTITMSEYLTGATPTLNLSSWATAPTASSISAPTLDPATGLTEFAVSVTPAVALVATDTITFSVTDTSTNAKTVSIDFTGVGTTGAVH